LDLRFILREVSKHLEQAGKQVCLTLIGKWDVRNLDAIRVIQGDQLILLLALLKVQVVDLRGTPKFGPSNSQRL